jgi:hypothetical protein
MLRCDKCKAVTEKLLAAAKLALEWLCSRTNWEDGVPYVNGRYDPGVGMLDEQLRAACAEAEKGS